MCRFASFANTFSLCKIDVFSVFCQGQFRKQPKFHIVLILTEKNALKWLQWCIFRVRGIPNPILQVSSLCDKQFMKNYNFKQKFHILLILTGKIASKFLEQCVLRVCGNDKSNGTCCESLQ